MSANRFRFIAHLLVEAAEASCGGYPSRPRRTRDVRKADVKQGRFERFVMRFAALGGSGRVAGVLIARLAQTRTFAGRSRCVSIGGRNATARLCLRRGHDSRRRDASTAATSADADVDSIAAPCNRPCDGPVLLLRRLATETTAAPSRALDGGRCRRVPRRSLLS